MKNIYRTPHQTACQVADQTDGTSRRNGPVENTRHQVPEIRILSVWNEHRQYLIQPRLHLL